MVCDRNKTDADAKCKRIFTTNSSAEKGACLAWRGSPDFGVRRLVGGNQKRGCSALIRDIPGTYHEKEHIFRRQAQPAT